MAMGDLIPFMMLVVLAASLILGLIGRHAGWAVLLSVVLFVTSWWFPQAEPSTAETGVRLHPFPVSLLLVILTVIGTGMAWLIGLVARLAYRSLRGRDVGTA
jgi:hypothetical protein